MNQRWEAEKHNKRREGGQKSGQGNGQTWDTDTSVYKYNELQIVMSLCGKSILSHVGSVCLLHPTPSSHKLSAAPRNHDSSDAHWQARLSCGVARLTIPAVKKKRGFPLGINLYAWKLNRPTPNDPEHPWTLDAYPQEMVILCHVIIFYPTVIPFLWLSLRIPSNPHLPTAPSDVGIRNLHQLLGAEILESLLNQRHHGLQLSVRWVGWTTPPPMAGLPPQNGMTEGAPSHIQAISKTRCFPQKLDASIKSPSKHCALPQARAICRRSPADTAASFSWSYTRYMWIFLTFILIQYWFILVHTGSYWFILIHTDSYWFILVHTDSYWFIYWSISYLIDLFRMMQHDVSVEPVVTSVA